MLSMFSANGIWLPLSSQLCSTLELAVMCRCAWACLITFAPGIFANVSAALRAAADRPIRVARLSSAITSLRTSEPADICGQCAGRHYKGVGFFLLRFEKPPLARATPHRSLNKSFFFIWRQVEGRLSCRSANPNRNSGGSNARPINFFTSQSHKT